MDKGEFVRATFTVEPCLDGSYIVMRRVGQYEMAAYGHSARAFSDYRDMLAWMREEFAVSLTSDGSKAIE